MEQYESIPLSQIREPDHRLRETIDPGALGELADSMAAEGLHQPIGVRVLPDPGGYEVIWGHRRLLAARLLLWPTIAARIFPTEYDPLLAAVSENLQRADLTPLDEAHALVRFVERGHPIVAMARLFRRSEQWVRERLALVDLPADLQEVVAARTLPLAVVRVLADVDHPEYRAELLREALRTGASAATAEVWRAHYLADRERLATNLATIQEMVERRESWRLMIDCDVCGLTTVYENTRSVRCCLGCHEALERELASTAPASVTS
jgi:ParB family chromosome partitioning protein